MKEPGCDAPGFFQEADRESESPVPFNGPPTVAATVDRTTHFRRGLVTGGYRQAAQRDKKTGSLRAAGF